jgi:hypothetical protein
MRRLTAFALGLVVCVLVAVAAADAKIVPKFSERVAAPGQNVVVYFGEGVSAYLAPLEVYLVPTAIEPRVIRRTDTRLRFVGRLGQRGETITARRLSFRVPRVGAGEYTLAVLFRGSQTGRWANLASGLWRDGTVGAQLRLRIAR